jgi:ketopantoate hydroxymethyltransferase
MDMILVGDSLAMVSLGMEDTNEVLLEEMLLHCKSVARATSVAFTVCTSISMVCGHVLTKHRWEIYPWEATKSLPSKP